MSACPLFRAMDRTISFQINILTNIVSHQWYKSKPSNQVSKDCLAAQLGLVFMKTTNTHKL